VDSKKFLFLKAVLGQDGAAALKKAADRLGGLEDAILPRAIMAWLAVAARGNFEGAVPGIDDSYLDFSKNTDGSYSGSIAIGEGVIPFQNATQFHLAASIALSLGAEDITGQYRDADLVKLGKSIDIMAKAKYVSNLDELSKALPGPAHAPKVRGVPEAATPPSGPQDEKGPPENKAKGKAIATQVKLPRPKAKALKIPTPKAIASNPQGKKPLSLSEDALKSECSECGLPLIKKEKFVGCLCLRDVARFVTLTKNQGKTYITFDHAIDEDGIATILETLGVSHG